MLKRLFITALIFLVCWTEADAQIRNLGGYFSPKGVGVSTVFQQKGSDNQLSLTALMDLTGILTRYENIKVPGSQIRFSYDYRLKDWIFPTTGTKVGLIAGPGLMVGYIRDHDKRHGGVLAATGEAGLVFDFVRDCTISLKFTVDLGVHYGRSATYQDINRYAPTIDPYSNGMRRIYYPELRIMRRF